MATRIAGATAVLALAAGATLGLGAWRTYQADQNDKKKEEALAAKRVSMQEKPTTSSPSPKPKPSVKEKRESVVQEKPCPGRNRSPSPRRRRPPAPRRSAPRACSPPAIRPASRAAHRRAVEERRDRSVRRHPRQRRRIPGPGRQPGRLRRQRQGQPALEGAGADARKGPGGTDLVSIANAKDGLCVDVPGRGEQPRGAKVIESRCIPTTADNQLYWIDPGPDGTVMFRNYTNDHQCLRLGAVAPDERLINKLCGPSPDARWTMII
ncbi:RICIN domain-containing protein [Streptomyces sp. M10(2022)]